MRNTADVTGGKPIAVLLQSISGVSAINPLVAFYDTEERERCYSFILSRTPHAAVWEYILHEYEWILHVSMYYFLDYPFRACNGAQAADRVAARAPLARLRAPPWAPGRSSTPPRAAASASCGKTTNMSRQQMLRIQLISNDIIIT
jgi:hypothetical protein